MAISDRNKAIIFATISAVAVSIGIVVSVWYPPDVGGKLDYIITGKEKTYGDKQVIVNRCYDGDTFFCDIPGWPDIIGLDIGIRLDGCDTPEMKSKKPEIKALAEAAAQYTKQRIEGKRVLLKGLKRDKYFRLDAHVWINGSDLGEELIAKGLGKEYHGETKDPWE